MKRYLVSCLFFAISATYAEAPPPLTWHSDNVSIKIYPHPNLCARTRNVPGIQKVGEKEGWHLYQAKPSDDCLPVYSSGPDINKSTLSVQDFGVLVQFQSGQSKEKIQQWLMQNGLEGEPLLLPESFLIKKQHGVDVNGAAAIQLAEWIRASESIGVVFAQPNWREQASTL